MILGTCYCTVSRPIGTTGAGRPRLLNLEYPFFMAFHHLLTTVHTFDIILYTTTHHDGHIGLVLFYIHKQTPFIRFLLVCGSHPHRRHSLALPLPYRPIVLSPSRSLLSLLRPETHPLVKAYPCHLMISLSELSVQIYRACSM